MNKSIGLLFFCCFSLIFINYANVEVKDISKTSVGKVHSVVAPKNIDDLQAIVRNAQTPLAIAGGRFSQGGHTWCNEGIVIDTKHLNRILHLDIQSKTITVEAGARWRDIQACIAPHGLSIKVMQSYNDFTVGGSLSVNVHGRDIAYGPIIETVESIKVMLADGSIVIANRLENYELFRAAIGGYGSFGIIVEATLTLTDNCLIERKVQQMNIDDYKEFFLSEVRHNSDIVFHNANVYPNDLKNVLAISWYKTTQHTTITEELMPIKNFYFTEMISEQILRRIQLSKQWRLPLELRYLYNAPTVCSRNYEMSATVAALEPLMRFPTTTVLQEYFIPLEKLENFIEGLRILSSDYKINLINVSIRYVPQNTESLLSYAQHESFSLVLYINILNTTSGLAHAQAWTRLLIDLALSLQGTYYLPYQLFATQEQFNKSYPTCFEFCKLKSVRDPHGKFLNTFIKKYF